jgi:DNA-binding FadR family transcriptional regulator
LIERSLDFLDLSLENHFFKVHKEICEVIAQKKPKEARTLIEKDIQDVREKLKEFKKQEKNNG